MQLAMLQQTSFLKVSKTRKSTNDGKYALKQPWKPAVTFELTESALL